VLGYVIPAEKANYLFEKYSYWRNFVLDMVVKNAYELFLVLNELISKRVDQRLVEYIKNNAKGNVIKATHEEIARDIGTAREVVSRLLKEWTKVKVLMPDYQKHHQWLEENGHLLRVI